MTPRTLTHTLLAAGLASGCAKRQLREDDPIAPLLVAADEAWDDRDDVGLEAAEEPLQEAYGLDPRRPEVLWRLARLHHALGYTEETERARLFDWAEARSMGLDCLTSDPTLEAARRRGGWPAVAEAVDDGARQTCLAWAAIAWSHWLASMGTGAGALDLEDARALAARAASDSADERAYLGTWSQALLDTTSPDWAGGDPTRGVQTFEVLVTNHPRDLLLRIDRLVYGDPFLTPDYRARLWEDLRSATARTPEERAALERVLSSE